MSNLNNLVPSTIQAKIKVDCSCKLCKTPHYETITFKLQIEKSDDESEWRKEKPDYPHCFWLVRYVSDNIRSYPLYTQPKFAYNDDLAAAMLEAKQELEIFINNNNNK